jgi:tRNA threonylcarbamoyladenosine modification (KEOPS) complex  Pcc1 subunit
LSFDLESDAFIAQETLNVDAEPSPEKILREITNEGKELRVVWSSNDLKILRAAVLSFFLNLELITETLIKFRPVEG